MNLKITEIFRSLTRTNFSQLHTYPQGTAEKIDCPFFYANRQKGATRHDEIERLYSEKEYLELIIEDNVFYSKPQYFSKSFPFHFFSLTLNEIIFLELSQELF